MSLRIVLCLLLVSLVQSYPDLLSCKAIPRVGLKIMAGPVVEDTSRLVRVFRNEVELKQNDVYYPHETLQIHFDSEVEKSQYLLQTSSGSFLDKLAICGKLRTTEGKTSLHMPGEGNVSIVALWAIGYEKVQMTSAFQLHLDPNAISSSSPSNSTENDNSTSTIVSSEQKIRTGELVLITWARFTSVDFSSLSSVQLHAIGNLIAAWLALPLNAVTVFKRPSLVASGSVCDIAIQLLGISTESEAQELSASVTSYLKAEDFLKSMKSSIVPSLAAVTVLTTNIAPSLKKATYHCDLSGGMKISWSAPVEGSLQLAASLQHATNWMSFGVIKPHLSMVPHEEPHSVFQYAGGGSRVGRYAMTTMHSTGFIEDSHPRRHSNILQAFTSSNTSYMQVDYSSALEGNDAPLHLEEGNYLIWAHGLGWPSIHTHRGFVFISWKKGTCVEVLQVDGHESLDPRIIFSTLLLIFLFVRTPFLNKTRVYQWLVNTRAPLLPSYSIAGAVAILIHCALLLAVLISHVSSSGWSAESLVSVTGTMAVMNLWMTLLPSSKSVVMLWITGVPFERSIKYHQLLSSLTIITALIHLILNASINSDILFSAEVIGDSVIPVLPVRIFS